MEIGKAGPLGFGIFAKRAIPRYTLVCEYVGRLTPSDARCFTADTSNVFQMVGTARVDSLEYGNSSRFVNHHCTEYNLDVVDIMYGRRKVLCFRTNRAIAKGEQLYITYGNWYWTVGKPCRCDAVEHPHALDRNHRPRSVLAKTQTGPKPTKVDKRTRKAGVRKRARFTRPPVQTESNGRFTS